MLGFLKDRSYDIVKMFLYQIAIALFGISLAIATGSKNASVDPSVVQPATLQIVTSIFSILFYLFLIYNLLWNIGAKDAHRFARKEPGVYRLAGLYMGLAASVVNILIAILIMLGNLLSDIPFFSNAGGVAATVGLLIEGMYTGLLAIRVGGVPINSLWPIWFVIILPMIATASLAYFAGLHEFRIFAPVDKNQ
jgi:hypothetical protein